MSALAVFAPCVVALLDVSTIPVLRPLHQLVPQRVAFDMAEHSEKVVIIINRKGFEPTLPDMACGTVMAMIVACTGREQPLHPPPQIAIMMGSEDQVEMVGHPAMTEHINRNASADIGHRIYESAVIPGLVKDRLTPVPSI